MAKKFVRTQSKRYSKLGRGRKKLQKWRKPKGRDNKIRESRRGKPNPPSVGYKRKKTDYGKVKGLYPLLIYNLKDLKKVNKDSGIVIGKVGAKKKIELVKAANEKKLHILNFSGGANATK